MRLPWHHPTPHTPDEDPDARTDFTFKEATYQLVGDSDTRWRVHEPAGSIIGEVIMLSPEGEGGDPVYQIVPAGSQESLGEGSDGTALLEKLINEYLARDRSTSTGP